MTQGLNSVDNVSSAALCRLDAIVDGGVRSVDVKRDGITAAVLVFRRGGKAYAYLNLCPYDGRSMEWMPMQFRVDDGVLTCAVHGDRFRIDTGECIGGFSRGRSLHAVAVRVNAEGCVELA